ncbi:hypothetical protein PMIN07_001515 [Paraphaeosphaeria minitans]
MPSPAITRPERLCESALHLRPSSSTTPEPCALELQASFVSLCSPRNIESLFSLPREMWNHGIELTRQLIVSTCHWRSRSETKREDKHQFSRNTVGLASYNSGHNETDCVAPISKTRTPSITARQTSWSTKLSPLQPGRSSGLDSHKHRAVLRSILKRPCKCVRHPTYSGVAFTEASFAPTSIPSPQPAFVPALGDTLIQRVDLKAGSPQPSPLNRLTIARSTGSNLMSAEHSSNPTDPFSLGSPSPSTSQQPAMDSQDMGLRPPKRMRAIREKSNPVTTRRQIKNDERTLPGRQMEDISNTNVHDRPLHAPQLPPLPCAGSDCESSNVFGNHCTENLELPLSQGRAVWRSKKLPQPGGRTSSTSVKLSTTVKRIKPSAIDQMTKDRKISEPLEAIGHKLHDLGGQLEILNDEIQLLSDEVSMQNKSKRSSSRIFPSHSRDFRATGHDLRRLMKTASPSRDYRATSADLQRLMHNGSSDRNVSGARMPTIPNLISEEAPRLGVGHVSSSPASNASAARPLGAQGTDDDPIEICSDSEDKDAAGDEDEDVNMFYDCDATPAVQNPPVLTRQCAVCSDSIHIADVPSLSRCTHQAATCVGCFARWIESQLTTQGWNGISCPDVSCNSILTHYDVQAYATPEVFAQYDMYSMRDALGQVANFKWCRNSACTSGQEHDADGNIFTCAACGHKACVTHDVDWHEDETCDEYSYRVSGAKEREQKAQDEASVAAISKLSKKCPGPDCAFNIEKNEGCDHMTCSRCRYEFCWECLADYPKIRKKGNTAHEKTCKYHSSRLV